MTTLPFAVFDEFGKPADDRVQDFGDARYAAGAADEQMAQPTLAQLNSACMSYRHDFGLIDAEEQERLRFSAKEWLRAWQKELEVPSPSAAARAEPTDPLDAPIPADFTAAGATFRKGLPMRLIAKRIERLWEAAYGPMPTPEEQAANLARLQGAVSPQPPAEPRAEPTSTGSPLSLLLLKQWLIEKGQWNKLPMSWFNAIDDAIQASRAPTIEESLTDQDIVAVARKHSDVTSDNRGRLSYEFDGYGLRRFVRDLLVLASTPPGATE